MSAPANSNTPAGTPAGAASTARPSSRTKRQFATLSAEQQQRLIESGRKRVRNSTIRGSGCRGLKADNSTIHGDNNHVIGNFNVLIGVNNTAEGHNNTFSVPVEPEPPAPVEPPPPEARQERQRRNNRHSAPENPDEVLFELLLRSLNTALSQPPVTVAEPPPQRPPAQPEVDGCVSSALDLTGDALPAQNDEPKCDICMENQKDTLFKPCRHICCCRECARALARTQLETKRNTTFNCPKCRKPVTSLTLVYI